MGSEQMRTPLPVFSSYQDVPEDNTTPQRALLPDLPPLSVHGKSELIYFGSAGWSDPDGRGGVLYRASGEGADRSGG